MTYLSSALIFSCYYKEVLTISFIAITIFLAMLGAAVGSFINVLIFRTIDTPESFPDESWKTGRSRCDHCGRQLHWYENIPLLSFSVLRGRSSCCGKSLSITHPVVELLTASLFVWWFWGGTFFFQLTQQPFSIIQPIFWLLVGILLLVIAVSDIAYEMQLPQWALVGLFGLSLLYRLVLGIAGIMQWPDIWAMAIATVVVVGVFLAIWAVSGGRALGFGDVEFAAPMTLLLGWPNILVGLYVAVSSGALVGLLILGWQRFSGRSDVKRGELGHHIAFGPFLVLGTIVALLWGDWLRQWYWMLIVR